MLYFTVDPPGGDIGMDCCPIGGRWYQKCETSVKVQLPAVGQVVDGEGGFCGFISLVLVVTSHSLGLCLQITRSYWEYIFDAAGPEIDPENL